MEAESICESLVRYRGTLVGKKDEFTAVEANDVDLLLKVLDASTLRSFILGSKTAIREYGDRLFSGLSEQPTPRTIQEILFCLAAIVYEGAVHGALLEDSCNNLLNRVFVPGVDKTDVNNMRSAAYHRLALLVIADKTKEYVDELSKQKAEIEKCARASEAKTKENSEAISKADSNLNDYLDKAKDLKGELGFLVLTRAFTNFIKTKELEVKRSLMYLKSMGVLLLMIPLLAFICYQILPLMSNSVHANPVDVGHSQYSSAIKTNIAAEKDKKTASSLIEWPDIINRLLNFLPLAVAELILLFYFRILLSNFNAANAQLLQLRMRKSVCQFIQDYIEFKKKNDVQDLEKFDALIFSNLMPSADQIPATFEGLEHLGKILSEFKPKKD